jgi:hypothetical protein
MCGSLARGQLVTEVRKGRREEIHLERQNQLERLVCMCIIIDPNLIPTCTLVNDS